MGTTSHTHQGKVMEQVMYQTKLAFSCRACRAKGPCNMYRVMYQIDLFLQGKGPCNTYKEALSLFDSESQQYVRISQEGLSCGPKLLKEVIAIC